MEKIIVSRHTAMREYLVEQGLVDPDVQVYIHAGPSDVEGRHVYGMLPLHLASLAALVTQVPVITPATERGVTLSLENIRRYARAPQTYKIERIREEDIDAH